MQLLVDTLLAIARNTTNTLAAEQMLLSIIIRDLVNDLEPVGQNKGINICVQYDIQESPRIIYPSMTKMVLSNILRNALNYSQGTHIHIIQRKNSIVIADNGIGIDMPSESKNQELSTTELKLNAKGYGIGLQLVQKLCKQLGWRVELFDRQYYLKSHKYLELENETGLIVVVYMS